MVFRRRDIERNKLEKDLEAVSLDLTELRVKLNTRFECLENEDEDKDEDGDKEEPAMAAQEKSRGKKQFKGRCYKCGKWGYKGAECKNTSSSTSNQKTNNKCNNKKKKIFNGECNYCGKYGHKEADCFKK